MTQMNNDNNIMLLKEKVESKRKELDAMPKRVVPITNCMITLDGNTTNLHTCSINDLKLLFLKLNAYRISAQEIAAFGLRFNNIEISGYSLSDWMTDIKSFIQVASYKSKKKELDALEKQLDNLLSADKRTELEIEKIAALLG